MAAHFSQRQQEEDATSNKMLAEMDALVKEMKSSREALTKDNSALDQAIKAVKPKKSEPHQ